MRSRNRDTISSSWLVRVLADSPRASRCDACGARMFATRPSGLCPVCFTRREDRRSEVDRIAGEQSVQALGDWTQR